MKKLVPQRWRSTVVFDDGKRVEIEEPLPVETIIADARRAGAIQVEIEYGTEVFLNESGGTNDQD